MGGENRRLVAVRETNGEGGGELVGLEEGNSQSPVADFAAVILLPAADSCRLGASCLSSRTPY